MAQPTPYDRITNFQNQQSAAPTDPYPSEDFDAEFNAVKITTDEILQNLELIQRDDGQLANGSVGRDQLAPDVDLGFGAPSVWVTATSYIEDFDTVFEGTGFYKCIESHTSGTFATDLAAEKWELIADFSQATQDAIDAAAEAAASEAAAAASASAASASASSASTSASGASTSASAASTSASAASTSASAASTSASAASTSASNASTSASSASTSASAASTSASNASSSATAASSSAAIALAATAFRWNFDSSTTMADPGTADIRLNHATLSSVTAIAISANTGDSGNPDASDFVATWDDSTSSLRGTIVIRKQTAPENFAVYSVTGALTDNTTWLQLAVTYVAHAGSFSAADALSVSFFRTGNVGATGGSGDFSSNTATSVDGEAVVFSGTGGKTGKRLTATGVLKAASGVLSAATAGTDYVAPGTATTFTAVQGYAAATLTYAASQTWDVSANPVAKLAPTGNVTSFSVSNVTEGRVYVLKITQDTTARTIAYTAANFKFIDGTAPTLSPSSGAVDYHVFIGVSSTVLHEIGRAQAVS